ncbi:MAG TPA: alpha/beta family hydrolase [Vicinamibacteria bacterium]|nr:alpha/beta family hydrolase [Vicinamibacteria bacterium]
MTDLSLPGLDATASLHGRGRTVVVLGHGAGGNRHTPMLVALAGLLAASGRAALLYNFPYAEAGRRRPDPPSLLEETTRAAGRLALEATGARAIVHGGRSMGGRIASQVVAAGERADGLALLAYPLHPPGQPGRLRDAHLPLISVPMLFVQGTRDAFARSDLLQKTIRGLAPRAELVLLADADHSFGVLQRSGRSAADVLALVTDALVTWLDRHGL